MKLKYSLINALCIFSFLIIPYAFGSCDKAETSDSSGSSSGSSSTPDDKQDQVDNSYFSTLVTISWDSTPIVNNPLENNGVDIQTNGDEVVIKSTAEEVEYLLTGTTTSGFVKIYSDYKFKLTMNGVDITNPTGPAINIQSHKRVFVEIKDGTVNKLTDGISYKTVSGEDMKAAFFSEGQLIFSGEGRLQVTGNYKHAICSDDYIRIYKGNITAISNVSDGIHTNSAFVMDGGTLDIESQTDGIECEKGYIEIFDGTITITSGDDGIAASYEENDTSIDPYLVIHGGTIQVTTSGISAKAIKSRSHLTIHNGDIKVKTSQREAEGIESKKTLVINNGTIVVEAYDDCLNAATHIEINGGDIYCYSQANDGVDSNGTLLITGGRIIAVGTSSPEEGFDCDHNTFKITGGTILGIGGSTSTPTSNTCTQRSVLYAGSGTANTLFHIETSEGINLLTYELPRTLSSMTVLYSSLEIITGSYSIYSGGSVSGGSDFYGLYENTSYTQGTQLTTFHVNSMVTTVGRTGGENGEPNGGPNGPGGWW